MKRALSLPVLLLLLQFLSNSTLAAVKLIPLLSFDGTNGSRPHCNLVQTKNGEFYGTTTTMNNAQRFYPGNIFKISANGQFSIVAKFEGTFGVPWDGLMLGNDGNFYGTAQAGDGTINSGAVFKMNLHGKITPMAFFNGTNGASPNGLLQGVDGNFYGITQYGGDQGDGTVFKMSPEGNLTMLFAFDGTNGTTPWSLIQARDGNLYGTTLLGGAYESGTVFQITTNGVFTTLWNCDGTNGSVPQSVIQAADGNLYGEAYSDGPYYNGTIFKLTTNGALTILHSFSTLVSYGENADGANPLGKLLEGKDGCIYGGTQYGGTNLSSGGESGGAGTLFKITTNGALTTLCSFGTCTNSSGSAYSLGFPNGLIEDQKGNFFGTTYLGGLIDFGNGGLGSVFKLITVKPILAITKPHQGAHLKDSSVTVIGKTKAKVDTAITNVLYQLNGSDWSAAVSTNNWTNWTADITLTPGTNILRTFALDANGDASRTNMLKLQMRKQ